MSRSNESVGLPPRSGLVVVSDCVATAPFSWSFPLGGGGSFATNGIQGAEAFCCVVLGGAFDDKPGSEVWAPSECAVVTLMERATSTIGCL